MTQLVKHPILGFGSGHDLTVHGFVGSSPVSGSALTAWSLLGILSPSFSLRPTLIRVCTHAPSLSCSQIHK